MSKRLQLYIVILIIVTTFLSCTKSTLSNNSTSTEDINVNNCLNYFPTNGWKKVSPESQGMDSKKLSEAIDYLVSQDMNIHSLVIVRNGYLITEAYFSPYQRDSLHDIASISKSIVSSLMGIAIDQGYIEDVNMTLDSFFPEITNNKKYVSIKDLLTMRTGLAISDFHMIDFYKMLTYGDWQDFIFNMDFDNTKMRNQFQYNNFAPYLSSSIIKRATQIDSLAFADKYLFEPLGIKEYTIPVDPYHKNMMGYGEIRIKPTDLAKIGLLYLNDGIWDGKQIISSKWIKESTSRHVDINQFARPGTIGYGYYWWLGEEGYISGRGRNNQRLDIFPKENLIVVINSNCNLNLDLIYSKINTLYNDYILEGIQSNTNIEENQEEYLKLLQKEKDVEILNSQYKNEINIKNELNSKYLDVQYCFDSNMIGIEDIIISKKDNQTYSINISLNTFGHPDDMILNINTKGHALYSEGRNNIPSLVHLQNMDTSSIDIHINELGNIDIWNARIEFEEDTLNLSFIDALGEGKDTLLTGKAIK